MNKHLTVQQLIEFDEHAHSHILSCDQCRDNLQHLTQIRSRLHEMPLLVAPAALELQIDVYLQNQSTSLNPQASSYKKTFAWQTAYLAMAASVVVIVAISGWRITAPDKENVYTELAQMIDKNNQLFDQQTNEVTNTIGFIDLQLDDELTALDAKIQNAYLNHASAQQKLRLWEQRYQLLSKIKQSQLASNRHKI